MTRLHRASCPGLRALVLAGSAVVALAVPAQAAAGAPAVASPATGSVPAAAKSPADSDRVRPSAPPGPPVHGRGRHDFGWQ
ncbi:hypothetical protein [Streptomyces sp. NPDC086010]|uniref:hypothetical protein n=1 Tax=Streptomyces sp. NPDC086010 TaxID=3365745 RepID=UPI0037D47DAA